MILPSFGPSGRHLLLLLALLNVLSAKVGIGHGHDHQGRGIFSIFSSKKKFVKSFDSYDKNCFFPHFFQPSFSQNRICDIWWMTELTYHLPRSVFFSIFSTFLLKFTFYGQKKRLHPTCILGQFFSSFFHLILSEYYHCQIVSGMFFSKSRSVFLFLYYSIFLIQFTFYGQKKKLHPTCRLGQFFI